MLIHVLTEQNQPRVAMGAAAQQSVADWLTTHFGIEIDSIAGIGQRRTDIQGTYNGANLNFEVKNVDSPVIRIVLFNTIIERPRATTATSRKAKEHPVINRFIGTLTNGDFHSFNNWIDSHRKINQTIGFPGDFGVRKRSGVLPPHRTVSGSKDFMRKYQRLIVNRLAESDIQYFVFVINGVPRIYHASGPNPLNAKPFPYPSTVMLDTYGKPGSGDFTYGRMRIALKGTFKI